MMFVAIIPRCLFCLYYTAINFTIEIILEILTYKAISKWCGFVHPSAQGQRIQPHAVGD